MFRHRSPFSGLHRFRQAQQLALEMVQRVGAVIQLAPIGKRIVSIKQDIIQRPGDRENARQTNRPQGLEPVGILDNLRLFAQRRNSGAKAMRLNGVEYGRIAVDGKIGKEECRILCVFCAAITEERLRSGWFFARLTMS